MNSLGDKLVAASGLISQIAVGYCCCFVHWSFDRYWHEVLKGSLFPQCTEISLTAIRILPMAVSVLLLVSFVLPILRKRIVWWTVLVVMVELLILALLMMCISFPAMCLARQLSP